MNIVLKKLVAAAPGFPILILLIESVTGWGSPGRPDRALAAEAALNLVPLLAFIAVGTLKMRQRHLADSLIQASFYIYLWGVLRWTLLPLPFADIYRSAADSSLMGEVLYRLNLMRHPGLGWINLVPFHKFEIYSPFHLQVTGNLGLLLPLGIFLPLLSRKVRTPFRVLAAAFLASLAIETMQLTFTLASPLYHRTFDVDDIMLNTLGAGLGYGLYRLAGALWTSLRRGAGG